jgi:predicted TIM-barrel fold metal-dependent hydrolase
MTTRRQALAGMGALAATGIVAGGVPQSANASPADAPAASQNLTARKAIDVHAHYLTPAYRQALIDAGQDHPDGMPNIPAWDAGTALGVMDATGVAVALLSVSSPGFVLGDSARTRDLVRQVNDEGAALVGQHPDRFGLFASVPLPDVAAAVAEAVHALDDLHADGIALETNYGGTYLGDPAFRPLLAELHRRAAVVVLHPTSPACWQQTALGRARPLIEFAFDTTRTVVQLALDRVLEDYPGIRFVIPHAGAALPVLADRVAAFALTESDPSQPSRPPVDVIAALRELHYDVAGFTLPRALPALLDLVGPDRLLYGSDYPFTPAFVVKALATQLAATGALNAREKAALFHANAAQLFPRLAS